MNAPRPVLRVIARLNVGGPSIQAITLTKRLDEHGFRTTLVRGREGEREGSMDALAERLGVSPERLATLAPPISPADDLRALISLRRIIGRDRPRVLHTHTAKAGTLGRLAALTRWRARPDLIVHTFHGHVLSGYFSRPKAAFFTWIERVLARRTDVLIAVSEEVKRDLVGLGVAPAERITVVHLGFDLAPFLTATGDSDARDAMRRRLGVDTASPLVTLVARLVPIKRVDLFLDAAARIATRCPDVRFAVAGDGELRDELHARAASLGLGDRIVWPGFVSEMPALNAASDVVALCSDNEGTPVSLIEALAAGRPVVSTDVGGVATVVAHERTGLLVPPDDPDSLAGAITRLLDDPQLAQRLGDAGAADVHARFSLDRLVADIVRIYEEGLRARVASVSSDR